MTPSSNQRVLRVVLEGMEDAQARLSSVGVTGIDQRRDDWPSHMQSRWDCLAATSEFDLGSFLSTVEGAVNWDLRVDGFEVRVYHPLYRIARVRVPVSSGTELSGGRTVYEARVRLEMGAPHEFWPEGQLAVRDSRTRAQLEDVELRCVPTAFMADRVPGSGLPYTMLGSGLTSPIALVGGRETGGPEGEVTGLALGSAANGALRVADLAQPEAVDRGVLVYARAPGYAWGRIVVDVSKAAERELLLDRGATLDVRVSNVQFDRYAELESRASLLVARPDPKGGTHRVWSQRVDDALVSDGVHLDGVAPGELIVSVQLGGAFSWKKVPVLARETLSLAAGEARELELALADPPAPPVRAAMGGVLELPLPIDPKSLRLDFYEVASNLHGEAAAKLAVADCERVGGSVSSWSFQMEELPVGLYQVQLRPLMKSWMVELPEEGRADVELVVAELADVTVETVDGASGQLVPLESLRYGRLDTVEGQLHRGWSSVPFDGVPGRFRFLTAPGAAFAWAWSVPEELKYGLARMDLDLVAGEQTVRLELEPLYAIRIEFRDGGKALPRDDDVWVGLSRGVSAIDHGGQVVANRLQSDRILQVSKPGVYEINFEGIGGERFHRPPPRRVDVAPGAVSEVVVELNRK